MRNLVLIVLFIAVSINAETLLLFDTKIQLPEGWTVFQRFTRNDANELIVRLRNEKRKIQIEIGIGPNKKTFEEAAAMWKSKAENPPANTGLTVSDEHYQIVPRGSGKQAILSFRLGKGGVYMFVVSRFWIDKGKEVAVGATSMRDVSNDGEVIKIFDSIAP